MVGLLTREIVQKAIDLATPSIEAILKEDDTVWGPRHVVVVVPDPESDQESDLGSQIECIARSIGKVEEWKTVRLRNLRKQAVPQAHGIDVCTRSIKVDRQYPRQIYQLFS